MPKQNDNGKKHAELSAEEKQEAQKVKQKQTQDKRNEGTIIYLRYVFVLILSGHNFSNFSHIYYWPKLQKVKKDYELHSARHAGNKATTSTDDELIDALAACTCSQCQLDLDLLTLHSMIAVDFEGQNTIRNAIQTPPDIKIMTGAETDVVWKYRHALNTA